MRLTSEINGEIVAKCDFDNEMKWITVRGGPYSYDHERFLTGPIAEKLKQYEDLEERSATARERFPVRLWNAIRRVVTGERLGRV